MASAGKTGNHGGSNVTKKHLVDSIVGRTGLARGDVQVVVQGVLDELIEAVRQGNRVELRDFGVFEVKARAARTAQNPKTLEPVPVPPKLAVRFKAGRLMKSALDDRSREAMHSNGHPAAGSMQSSAAEVLVVPGPSTNGHATKARNDSAARQAPPVVEIPSRQPASASQS